MAYIYTLIIVDTFLFVYASKYNRCYGLFGASGSGRGCGLCSKDDRMMTYAVQATATRFKV